MSVDRPTFSDNWHRVAELRPRLRTVVRTYRQQYRGRMWHVLDDTTNNQFFRLDDAAYHLIALLDGRRTVSEAWDIANEDLGDAAPTQGEVIRLLGQLYTSNLLHAELPPDAEQMFERYKKRIRREVGGYLASFLFLRIPLWDPNNVLKTWVRAFGWMFSPIGFALWCLLMMFGFYQIAGQWDELIGKAADPQWLMQTENLLLLYASFAAVKFIHEMGHGFACVRFGQREGTSGAVHTMGIMMLVLMPVPYVDATSSWAFRSKWRRAMVAAAGMYIELAVAAVAAIVWAATTPGTAVNELAFNIIFIASVSTVLFNANPLLRFDGYYILSDTIEVANLSGRSKQYLYYLVRKYIYGVQRTQSPAHTRGERVWLAGYGVASTIYRVIISIGILLYLSDMLPQELFPIVVLMMIGAVVAWVFVPLGKFVKYLATSPELDRTRLRAQLVTGVLFAAIIGGIGLIPAPDRGRAEGVVEPVNMAVVHMPVDGFVDGIAPSGSIVTKTGEPVVIASNRALVADRQEMAAAIDGLRTRLAQSRSSDPAARLAYAAQMKALRAGMTRIDEQIARLDVAAPVDGVWVVDDSKQRNGVFLKQGERIGLVADTGKLIVRVAADQSLGPRIKRELGVGKRVEMRVPGVPDRTITGTITALPKAGTSDLPSEALGYIAGGSLQVRKNEQGRTEAAEPFFEVHVTPDEPGELMIGQRLVVRFTMPSRPLMVQWYRSISELMQRRFKI